MQSADKLSKSKYSFIVLLPRHSIIKPIEYDRIAVDFFFILTRSKSFWRKSQRLEDRGSVVG